MTKGEITIETIEWGKIEVQHLGARLRFRDCKVWPTGANEWDWRVNNTHHRPGIQLADIQELLQHGVEVMILTRGMQLVLQTCSETIEFLREAHIEHYVEETTAAVHRFNELTRQGRRVAGVFHSTC